MREVRSAADVAACARVATAARPFEHFDQDRHKSLIAAGKVRVWLDPLERGFVVLGGNGPGFRVLRTTVVPQHRRVGVGTALFKSAVAQVPPGLFVRATTAAHEAFGAAFASAMGLRRDHAHDQGDCTYARGLHHFEVTASPPPGIRVLPLADVAHDRLEALMQAARVALPDSHALHDEHDSLLVTADPAVSLVALDGVQPVGLTLVRLEGHLAHVLASFVDPTAQRRGVARALKVASMAAMRAAGHGHVITDCWPDNTPIRSLNESLGLFETTLIAWTTAPRKQVSIA